MDRAYLVRAGSLEAIVAIATRAIRLDESDRGARTVASAVTSEAAESRSALKILIPHSDV